MAITRSDFFRFERWPHMFCPGCGLGTIMNALYFAVSELNIDLDKLVMVGGIGCTGRIPGYLNIDSMHVTHGRAIPVAVGIKLANPKLEVIAIGGDGDIAGIGGNHLIHAARRNIDIKVIQVTNFNYALTGGQLAPTTPMGAVTTTTPEGNPEYYFDTAHLVAAAGANYVARYSTHDPKGLINGFKKMFEHRGFVFIEVISQCPINFGRRNKMRNVLDLLKWMREHSTFSKEKYEKILNEKGLAFMLGEIVKRNRDPLPKR